MTSPRARLLAVVSAAALVAATVAPGGAVAAPVGHAPAGAAFVATDEVLQPEAIAGSPAGVAWGLRGLVDTPGTDGTTRPFDVHYSAFGGAADVDAGLTLNDVGEFNGAAFSLNGDQLYLNQYGGDHGVDISTGALLTTRRDCIRSGSGCFAVNSGTGPTTFTYTDDATGTTTPYGPVLLDGTAQEGDTANTEAIDAHGVIIKAVGRRNGSPEAVGTLDYLDFASGKYTVLDGTDYAESGVSAMDADHIVWTQDEHAYYLDRDDLGDVPKAAAPGGAIDEIALNGDTLAYATISPDNDSDDVQHVQTIHTGPVGGSTFTAVSGTTADASQLVSIDSGDFAIEDGTSLTDFGIYRVVTGQAARGPLIARFGVAPYTPGASAPRGDYTAIGATVPTVIGPDYTWYAAGAAVSVELGVAGDVPVDIPTPGGVSQPAVFRAATGTWLINQTDGLSASVRWGTAGDIPVPGAYADVPSDPGLAVFRPSNGRWYVQGKPSFPYGTNGDIPVPGSYFDSKDPYTPFADDPAVFRPSNGTWYVQGHASVHFGTRGDVPVPQDYDGNRTADIAVYRPSNNTWYVRGQETVHWGTRGDIPVLGDYDGDGLADIAVYRPSNETWYVRGLGTVKLGVPGAVPVEAVP